MKMSAALQIQFSSTLSKRCKVKSKQEFVKKYKKEFKSRENTIERNKIRIKLNSI